MTVEEFARMETADTEAYELVDGVLVALSSPTPLHNFIRGRLNSLILKYVDENPVCYPVTGTDCRLSLNTVRRPDVSIFLADCWNALDVNKAPVPFAPNICVEILDPLDEAGPLTRKIREYLAAGSREVWVVDPENGEITIRTKSEMRIVEATDLLETPLLPGFSVSVGTLLGDL
jgi:Uma2 family endonuclease